jgi:cytochrome c oxidase subunit 1
MERGVTWAAFVLGAAQLSFLINIVWSARHGAPAGDNPWQATTLEWQPAPLSIRVERGPYEYHSGTTEVDFTPQWETASQQE